MKMKFTSVLMVALMAATMVSAQDVDKSKVQSQAAAAQGAQADLKGLDTGEKAWKFSGNLGLNAAATGLVNWTAGGNNNINGRVYTNLRLLYHANNISWDSNLDMEYGLTWIDQEYDKLQKSGDKLNFATKFGWEFHEKWYLTALGSFQTQFAPGRAYNGSAKYDPLNSAFMAPAYVDISLGIDWKPNDIFSLYLSPVAGRITAVAISDRFNNKINNEWNEADPEDHDLRTALKKAYGVWKYDVVDETTGQLDVNYKSNVRAELGLSFKGAINYKYKDLSVNTTLGLFTPYKWDKREVYSGAVGSDKDGMRYVNPSEATIAALDLSKYGYMDNNRRFGHFDVDWTVNLGYQFFNCLQVTLSTDLRYYNGVMIDKVHNKGQADEYTDSKQRVQFKGVIGVGVGYSF